jgi:hypothetical protein
VIVVYPKQWKTSLYIVKMDITTVSFFIVLSRGSSFRQAIHLEMELVEQGKRKETACVRLYSVGMGGEV